MRLLRLPSAVLVLACAAIPALAQSPAVPRALTADDYARAEKFMDYNTSPLVSGAAVRPVWIAGDRFWYRNTIAEGAEFVLVDPARRTRERAFDHVRLAAALSSASGTKYEPFKLPFQTFDLAADGASIAFDVGTKRYTCDVKGDACTAADRKAERQAPNTILSPDGARAAFIRGHNLWVREVATGRETPLTHDGVEDFGYATDNAGWTKSDRPVLLWSPDSKKIATFQHDARGAGEMYLVETKVGHPTLERWKYPLPGDQRIFTIQRVIVDVDGPRVIRLDMPPDPHRSSVCDHVVCGGAWADVAWSADASQLAFLSTSRDHKRVQLRIADAKTGSVGEILRESSPTFFESGVGQPNWRVLPASNEVIWFSQRDDWGHLYLYDLGTGQLKHQITRGAFNVSQVLRVDEKTRTIYFVGVGREPGDPYFRRFYSVRMDGSGLTLLTPEDADHAVSLPPTGGYFLDSYSTPTTPPVAVLRDVKGQTILTVEKADISRLIAAGWKPPIPITVKARDGKTDLYGLMFRPTDFDESRKYPIVNRIYPGPQSGSVGGFGSRAFSAARSDSQALAELGFIVVSIDAMGTPHRSSRSDLPGLTSIARGSTATRAEGSPQPTRSSAIPTSSRWRSARPATTTTAATRTTGARSGRACSRRGRTAPRTTTTRRIRTWRRT
jgi:hypothetical protein